MQMLYACRRRFGSTWPLIIQTDRVKVLRPARHRIGHFGDVLHKKQATQN